MEAERTEDVQQRDSTPDRNEDDSISGDFEDNPKDDRIANDRMSEELEDIPKGCILDCLHPGSPTAVTDFPSWIDTQRTVTLADTLQLTVSSERKLPTIANKKMRLEPQVNAINQIDDQQTTMEDTTPPTTILAPTIVADIGT
jgi:hypothetical protein